MYENVLHESWSLVIGTLIMTSQIFLREILLFFFFSTPNEVWLGHFVCTLLIFLFSYVIFYYYVLLYNFALRFFLVFANMHLLVNQT